MESVDEVPVNEIIEEPSTTIEVEAPKKGRGRQTKQDSSDGAKQRAPRKPKNTEVVIEEVAIAEEEPPMEAPKDEVIVETPKEEKPKRTRTKKNKQEQVDVIPIEGEVHEPVEVVQSAPTLDENLLTMYLLSQQTAKKQLKKEKYKRLISGAF
jgi:hypothetical protein